MGAFATLVNNLDECYSSLPWKVGVHGGKHGPMGEDLFAQKCMDLMGVAKQENVLLTRKRTRSSSHRAPACPHLRSIPSRSPRRMPRAGPRPLPCSPDETQLGRCATPVHF